MLYSRTVSFIVIFVFCLMTVSWAAEDNANKLCETTGGHYLGVEDCPPCPAGALCEACFVGCRCPQEKIWVETVGCFDPEPAPVDTKEWQALRTDHFTVSLPAGWTMKKLNSDDSFAGELSGNGVTLTFDYSYYYQSGLPGMQDAANFTFDTMLDGVHATAVLPKETGKGTTGILISSMSQNLYQGKPACFYIYGRDLSAEDQALARHIFNSIQFERPAEALPMVCDNEDFQADFTLNPDGVRADVRLTGSFSVPTPGYKYELRDTGSYASFYHTFTVNLKAPEGTVAQVISQLDFDETLTVPDEVNEIHLMLEKKFNWGPHSIKCRRVEPQGPEAP